MSVYLSKKRASKTLWILPTFNKGSFNTTTTWPRRGEWGVSQKSMLVHRGGALNIHVDHIIVYCNVMGGKKEMKLHQIKLNRIVIESLESVQICPCIMLIKMRYMLIF